MELDPRNAYAYYNRGISRDRSGMYLEAVRP
jgi:lipoprotein NlpI